MKGQMQFYAHQYSSIVILTRIKQNETERDGRKWPIELTVDMASNTRLDFFEFGEQAKDFLDTKTRKLVLDKFRMLEIRLQRLFKGMDSIEMGVGRPSNPRCLNLYAKHRNK
jgi:hypothetical protein